MPTKPEKKGPGGLKMFVGLVVAMVLLAVVVGLYVAGSPSKERERQLDNQRVNELQQISSAVDSAYHRDGRLPQTLESLIGSPDLYMPSINDPKTGVPYEYRTTGADTYELCATFDMESQKTDQYGQPVPASPPMRMVDESKPYPGYRSWVHPAGRYCFSLMVEVRMPTQLCSLTNPCQAGQTCAQLPDRKGTYCVPAGKECLAAGCPDGQCVIMESYPVQVRCTNEPTPPPPTANDCTLMRESATGRMDCFGCGSRVCKDPAPGWEPYSPPRDQPGIPYACYLDENGACALAQ